ncbi:MAG: DUF3048 domain-containing protein [Defluviitaleaceae bacterium]|nr:DUF3048 domain-containing protein [Defluviitaleaceae bacterium]
MGFFERFQNLQVKKALIPAGIIAAISLVVAIIFITVNLNRRGDVAEPTVQEIVELPPTPTPTPTPEPEPEPEEEEPEEEPEPYDPGPRGILTGLPIYEEYINRRPVAVVVNNSRAAWPQSGLPAADVIYEILTEGDVTRLIAIFQTEIPDRIGPVRSARDFFVDMSNNHDAIFVHHGGTNSGYARVRDPVVTNLDGMALETTVFWRDRSFPAWTGLSGQRAMEHSSYTGWSRIATHMEAQNMRMYMNDAENFGFTFGEIPEEIESIGIADNISVPFSAAYGRRFIFEPEYGHYLVENRNGPHRDAETQEQLVAHNILIQFARRHGRDAGGFSTGTIVGEGRGYLITGGQRFEVRWEKTSQTAPTRWYFACDTPLVLPPGKTWICVFQDTGTITFGG